MPRPEAPPIEALVYEGALGVSEAGGLFVLLALFIAWLAWRERSATGGPVGLLLAGLRLGALALVIWMLLGPTLLETRRASIPRSIAIVLDVSESMRVPQPLTAVEARRWGESTGLATGPTRLAAVDAATVALGRVDHSLSAAVDASDGFSSAAEVAASVAEARNACLSAAALLQNASRHTGHAQDVTSTRLSTLASDIRQVGVQRLEELGELLERSAGADREGVRASLEQSLIDGDRWSRVLASIQAKIGSRITAEAGQSNEPMAEATRSSLATSLLDRLDATVLADLASEITIKRIVVDQAASTLPVDSGWTDTVTLPNREDAATLTNLSAAFETLSQQEASDSLVEVFLFSDGDHNAPGAVSPSASAAGIGVPVNVIPVATLQARRDVLVHRLEAPSSVALNDLIVIGAILTGRHMEGESVTVELRREGHVVDSREVRFDGSQEDQRVEFTVKATDLGPQEFEVVIGALPDEASETNNSAVTAVRVVRDTMRVLLAERISSWEYRYLDQLWRRDPRVEYDKLLYSPQLQATGKLASSRELPRTVDEWGEYDVAIIGDLEPAMLDAEQQSALEEWIRERGGNVVLIAGKNYMPVAYQEGPLTRMLPVQKASVALDGRTGYLPVTRAAGLHHEAMMLADSRAESEALWAEQYRSQPIYYLSPYSRLKPGAHVLLDAAPADGGAVNLDAIERSESETVLLSWQMVGAGRCVFLASPTTWRLRYRRGDELHHRFWGQMLRWLTAPERGSGQQLAFISASRAQIEQGKPLDVVVTLADRGQLSPEAGLSAVAESPSGRAITIPLTPDAKTPGQYVGTFEQLQPGGYQISAKGEAIDAIMAADPAAQSPTTLVNVLAPSNPELADTSGNRSLLAEIAAQTSGQVLPPTGVAEAIRLASRPPQVIENSKRTPLWNRWPCFWLVVGCLAAEWGVRRGIGLI